MNYLGLLKNKYLIASIAFVVWMLFFDERNLPQQLQRYNELKDLELGKAHYEKLNTDLKKELEGLANDPAMLEKYAREKHLMKRDNEDIFPVEE